MEGSIIFDLILLIFLGYLTGSIPFGYLYSRWIEGEDIRTAGSGNIGATNIIRTYGWAPGLTTLFLDYCKGAFPVFIAGLVLVNYHEVGVALTGSAAILGHVLPLYLKFDGGKGVATSAGVFSLLLPRAFGLAVLLFALGLLTRYMSVGSLLGALTLPLASSYFYGPGYPGTIVASLIALVVIFRHRKNIERLVRGEENHFF